MIPQEKKLILIKIYMYICKIYESDLKYCCQRYSNNSNPRFTDQEIMTIYLFVGHCQKYFQVKDIHRFAKEYLLDWFPLLPSYQTFNYRLNLLSGAFSILTKIMIESFTPDDCQFETSIVDSMPIITCGSTKRVAKVAREITTKGFCSTKNKYFYGLKLHALAFRREGTIPFPESLVVTPAEDSDLAIFKQAWGEKIHNRSVYGDRVYSDSSYFNEQMKETQNVTMLTPVKSYRGETTEQKQRDRAYNGLFSYAVSKIRQPIESFFNWLEEKTSIQRASKVRSTSGLWVHMMGKIAIAFCYLIFKY